MGYKMNTWDELTEGLDGINPPKDAEGNRCPKRMDVDSWASQNNVSVTYKNANGNPDSNQLVNATATLIVISNTYQIKIDSDRDASNYGFQETYYINLEESDLTATDSTSLFGYNEKVIKVMNKLAQDMEDFNQSGDYKFMIYDDAYEFLYTFDGSLDSTPLADLFPNGSKTLNWNLGIIKQKHTNTYETIGMSLTGKVLYSRPTFEGEAVQYGVIITEGNIGPLPKVEGLKLKLRLTFEGITDYLEIESSSTNNLWTVPETEFSGSGSAISYPGKDEYTYSTQGDANRFSIVDSLNELGQTGTKFKITEDNNYWYAEDSDNIYKISKTINFV